VADRLRSTVAMRSNQARSARLGIGDIRRDQLAKVHPEGGGQSAKTKNIGAMRASLHAADKVPGQPRPVSELLLAQRKRMPRLPKTQSERQKESRLALWVGRARVRPRTDRHR
jgi:hypothetical protein